MEQMVYTWRGKRIREMSREELIEALEIEAYEKIKWRKRLEGEILEECLQYSPA